MKIELLIVEEPYEKPPFPFAPSIADATGYPSNFIVTCPTIDAKIRAVHGDREKAIQNVLGQIKSQFTTFDKQLCKVERIEVDLDI